MRYLSCAASFVVFRAAVFRLVAFAAVARRLVVIVLALKKSTELHFEHYQALLLYTFKVLVFSTKRALNEGFSGTFCLSLDLQ